MTAGAGASAPGAAVPSADSRELPLEAEDLTVRLGGGDVLRAVTLRVGPGEVVGVFGPSGAGKSTLFRALAGEAKLVRGRVRLAGRDVTALPLWERARLGLGYLPQTPSVLWDLTVAENLAVFAALGRSARREHANAKDAATVARELGLEPRMGVKASALSGGERRRLELARALSTAPRVLLCDEPFAAIDPHGAERVAARVREAAAAGTAVVIADHHVGAALRLCGRALLVLGGEIAVDVPAAEFTRDELVRRHYVVA